MLAEWLPGLRRTGQLTKRGYGGACPRAHARNCVEDTKLDLTVNTALGKSVWAGLGDVTWIPPL
jgi:hypothetical protein